MQPLIGRVYFARVNIFANPLAATITPLSRPQRPLEAAVVVSEIHKELNVP
jgi:hypothetical protein